MQKVDSLNNKKILYNVVIKRRKWNEESENRIVRFQTNTNNQSLNIPVFLNDTLLVKGMYYDLFKYSILHGLVDKDSSISFVKSYSNKVMNLYAELNVHEIQGGLPNLGELAIMRLITGERLVYIPDTSKIINQNWKERIFNKSKEVAEDIYLIPE